MTKWIDAKAETPTELKPVNVVWVNRNPPKYYSHVKDIPYVATAVYYSGHWYWWDAVIEDMLVEYGPTMYEVIDSDIEITHWAYLPKPPQEMMENV